MIKPKLVGVVYENELWCVGVVLSQDSSEPRAKYDVTVDWQRYGYIAYKPNQIFWRDYSIKPVYCVRAYVGQYGIC